jgi:hypothetical protein
MIIYEKLTVNHYLDIKPNAHLTREFNDTTIEFVLPPELEPAIILHDCICNSLYRIGHTCAIVRLSRNLILPLVYNTSIMSELTGKYMLSLVREAIKTIEELPYTRLEAQVVADYKEGCRLMEVLCEWLL